MITFREVRLLNVIQELRKYVPEHVASGEHGGEFTAHGTTGRHPKKKRKKRKARKSGEKIHVKSSKTTGHSKPGGGRVAGRGASGKAPRVPEKSTAGMSEKALRAQANYKKANAAEQRYAESQETVLAKGIKGQQSDDNRPVDVTVKGKGGVEHGIECKTLVSGKNDKITMKDHAVAKKVAWVNEVKGREIHTVVMDHRDKFNEGEFKELHSGHELYYKRGVGAFRVGTMYKVKDHTELTHLMDLPYDKLPAAAQGPIR